MKYRDRWQRRVAETGGRDMSVAEAGAEASAETGGRGGWQRRVTEAGGR